MLQYLGGSVTQDIPGIPNIKIRSFIFSFPLECLEALAFLTWYFFLCQMNPYPLDEGKKKKKFSEAVKMYVQNIKMVVAVVKD